MRSEGSLPCQSEILRRQRTAAQDDRGDCQHETLTGESLNDTHHPPEIKTLVAYTAAPWEGALAVLRITAPLQKAGIEIIQGNQGAQIWPERSAQADAVLIQRDFPRFRAAYAQIRSMTRQAGIPIIFDLDDLLLAMPPDHSNRSDYLVVLFPILQAILEADALTTTTPALAAYLRPLNPNTFVLPNYLVGDLWPAPVLQSLDSKDSRLVIGYMGGETHCLDIEGILPAIQRIISRYKDRILFKFWGGAPPQPLLDAPGVEWTPVNNDHYADFIQFFARQRVDIWIAPLRDNLFNRCKSQIKFLEYSYNAIPGVYSRLEAYTTIVEDGVNGLLAGSLDEWEAQLAKLIESSELRQKLGHAAQTTVQDHWMLDPHAQDWVQAYQQVLASVVQLPSQPDDRVSRILEIGQQIDDYQTNLEGDYDRMRVILAERDETIHQLGKQLVELDRKAVTANNQLQDILASRSWQMIQRLQRLRLRLVPPGSRVESLLFHRRNH
jgi:processive 1,2-diacylglycerol beta-glucosyltransferase